MSKQVINQQSCLEVLQKLAQEIHHLQQRNCSRLERDLLVDELYGRCAQLADSLDLLEQAGAEVEDLEQQYIEVLMALSQCDQLQSGVALAHQSEQNQKMSLLALMPPLVPSELASSE